MLVVKDIAKVKWSSLTDIHKLDPKEAEAILDRSFARMPTVLPQLMAFISSSFSLVRNAEGLINLGSTISTHMAAINTGSVYFKSGEPVTEDIMVGMFRFMSYKVRSTILPKGLKQSSVGGLRWAANVPLFFSAFKEYRDVPYEDWDFLNASPALLGYLLDPKLLEVINYRYSERDEYTPETLSAIRDNALPIKTGARAGEYRTPESCTSIYSSGDIDPLFSKLPGQVKLMLCQVWVYCPSFRHKLGWYSIDDFDSYPVELDGMLAPVKKLEESMGDIKPW